MKCSIPNCEKTFRGARGWCKMHYRRWQRHGDPLIRKLQLRRIKHGHQVGGRKTIEYCSWDAMLQRCFNPSNSEYRNYGARGITVCERWKVFGNFISDMGLKPSPKFTLERVNNNGNYEPSNCKWAVRAEQARNKRTNRLLTVYGITRCLSDWAESLGVKRSALDTRLRLGWSDEKTLLTPVRPRKRK